MIAAPWSNGRARIGAAVLSTISGMPSGRPIAATSAIGKHGQLRVRQGLGVIGARLRVGGAAEVLGIGGVDEAHLDALVLQRVGELVPGAAVEVGRRDDVVAGVRDVLDRVGARRLAARQRQRRDAALRARRRASPARRWSGS